MNRPYQVSNGGDDPVTLSGRDQQHLDRAIELAHEAGRLGNLPIGCVICLDDQIVAEGQNWIWAPRFAPYRHAELEAMRALPEDLVPRLQEMTLYTTLEPCLMCAGAILLHGIGRVVFGAVDDYGGLGATAEQLPPYFAQRYARTSWIGPAPSKECDLLYKRVMELVTERGD
jgi:tRNA(adenine34) deaminase